MKVMKTKTGYRRVTDTTPIWSFILGVLVTLVIILPVIIL